MSPPRQWLGRIGLAFTIVVIVSPAVLFFLWMLSLSVKYEIDNARIRDFHPGSFNWGNYARHRLQTFSTYFMNSLIVTVLRRVRALVGVPAGYGSPACARTRRDRNSDRAHHARPPYLIPLFLLFQCSACSHAVAQIISTSW